MLIGEPDLFGISGPTAQAGDAVYTPDWAAADIVKFFKPEGRILEPCKGGGAFLRALPDGTEWCEIQDGRDFFDWGEHVDWIVTNPPYSILREFFCHAIKCANDIVFLIPAWRYFSAYGLIREAHRWGGLRSIRWYGTGSRLGFPMGNAISAMHWQRGHQGNITETFYEDERH